MAASNLDALTRDALEYYLFPLASKQEVRAHGPMIFSSAEGMEITDAAGRTYLDMMSTQTRASSLGYGQERIARAIYDQLMSLHYAGTFANVADVTVRLSARIADLAPGSLTATIYAGSGSEANEMSIKLAKQYHAAKGVKPRAHKIVSRWNAYHGATMGVIGSTDYLGTRAITEPGVPGFSRVPAPNLYRTPFGMDLVGGVRTSASTSWSSTSSTRGRRRSPPSSPSRSCRATACRCRRTTTSPGCARSATSTTCC